MKEENIIELSLDISQLKTINDSINMVNRYNEAFKEIELNMMNLNSYRGGSVQCNSGYVMENMHGFEKNIESIRKGTNVVYCVENDNGVSDILRINPDGTKTYFQAKKGYSGSNKAKIIDPKYKGQTILVNKGNETNLNYAKSHGFNAEESIVSDKKVDLLTKTIRKEADFREKINIGNNKTAPLTSKLYSTSRKLKANHTFATSAALNTAALAAGTTIGKNLYFLIQGDQDIKEFAYDAVKNTTKAALSTYGISFATNLAAPIAMDALAKITIFETAKDTVVQMGAITANVSIGMGPMFVIGLAIGCAYTGYKIVKLINESNRKYIKQINAYLDETNKTMLDISKLLNELSQSTIDNEIKVINEELFEMKKAILDEDYDNLNKSLDKILNLFNENILFDSQESFDNFFFGNEKYNL